MLCWDSESSFVKDIHAQILCQLSMKPTQHIHAALQGSNSSGSTALLSMLLQDLGMCLKEALPWFEGLGLTLKEAVFLFNMVRGSPFSYPTHGCGCSVHHCGSPHFPAPAMIRCNNTISLVADEQCLGDKQCLGIAAEIIVWVNCFLPWT